MFQRVLNFFRPPPSPAATYIAQHPDLMLLTSNFSPRTERERLENLPSDDLRLLMRDRGEVIRHEYVLCAAPAVGVAPCAQVPFYCPPFNTNRIEAARASQRGIAEILRSRGEVVPEGAFD